MPPVSIRILMRPELGRVVSGRRHLRGGRDLDLVVVEAAAKVDGAVDDCMSDEPDRGLFLLPLLLLRLLLVLGPDLALLPSSGLLLASLIGLFMIVVCFYDCFALRLERYAALL